MNKDFKVAAILSVPAAIVMVWNYIDNPSDYKFYVVVFALVNMIICCLLEVFFIIRDARKRERQKKQKGK